MVWRPMPLLAPVMIATLSRRRPLGVGWVVAVTSS
jgi:hypothetical protein